MKKLLPILLAIILTVGIFSGCNPLFPIDKDQFDCGDTISIRVGEKLYENEDLWIKLNKISNDKRYQIGDSIISNSINCEFLVGTIDSIITLNIGVPYLGKISSWYGRFNVSEDCFIGYVRYGLEMVEISPIRTDSSITFDQKDYEVSFVLGGPYELDKPNIYLYPTRKTRMTVSLDLPRGGKVTESIPAYPKKWKNIRVKPDGTINNKYDFLFYEADVPGDWQFEKGWSVAQKDLTFFFQTNLRNYGFNKKEIKDFTDWWIPRLKDYPYYEIYPQHTAKIESIIPLKINKEFDSLLRLFYFVDGVESKRELPEPVVPKFERDGFVVTEWGVSLR